MLSFHLQSLHLFLLALRWCRWLDPGTLTPKMKYRPLTALAEMVVRIID
jgi:hypothetical protein